MSPDFLLQRTVTTDAGPVCILELNRPERANAYHTALLEALQAAMAGMKGPSAPRALVITGTGGRAFCAGADRRELTTRRFDDGIDLLSRAVFDQLATMPIPTVACINGAAMGGGLELALACDIRVCAPGAQFALPELRLGLTPAAGGMRRLPALIGLGRAKEMILFQRRVDAVQAREWGLVAYQGEDFQRRALALAEQAAALDPRAVQLAKRLLNTETHPLQREFEAFTQALLYEQNFLRTHT